MSYSMIPTGFRKSVMRKQQMKRNGTQPNPISLCFEEPSQFGHCLTDAMA
jgi:hypothetical protein